MISKIKQEYYDTKKLLRNTPPMVMTILCISIILMNLFANKELVNISYLALDCGFLLSWISFLCMDMLTKRFGAKAAIKLSLIGILCNLCTCGVFFIIAKVGGNWSEFYNYNITEINTAINNTLAGSWYILFGSTVALACGSVVNSIINAAIGKILKNNSTFKSYALRSYVSTMIGQFIDNLIFALIVSQVLFGWTLIQCIVCSFVGAIAELLSEVIFSPIGFKVCKKWEKEHVGEDYINYINNGAKE